MSNIFCGPYSLYKKQTSTKDGNYESVISLCILLDNSLSERLYKNQQLMDTSITKSASLECAIQKAILRLEQLMQ